MKIKKSKLPQARLCKELDKLSQLSNSFFKLTTSKLIQLILSNINQSSLKKSEDGLKRGWTGEVPVIKIDLEKKVIPVIDKYMSALMYFLLGDLAGKEAKKAALSLGIKSDFVPGGVFMAYLEAIDAQRDYYQMIYNEDAPKIKKDLIEASFGVIQGKTERIISDSLSRYKNRILETINNVVEIQNMQNIANVQETAHELLEEGKKSALAIAIKEEAEKRIKASDLKGALVEVNESFQKDWDRNSETIMAMSAAAGTHQAIVEVFGANDSNVKAALVNIRDDRCCDACEKFARNEDGSLTVYNLRDFRPSGFNFIRKKADWELSIAPIHHRCRCTVVYIPPGFKILNDGTLTSV